MTEEGRRLHERDKRDFLQIEDIKLGDGPLAAWGRKIRADIEVPLYRWDGRLPWSNVHVHWVQG